MESEEQQPRGKGPAAALERSMAGMRTGAKVFLILVLSLLPLALIALFTTLQNTRAADEKARQQLHAVVEESSGLLANVLANHVAELHEGLAALEKNRADAPACTRVAGAFAALSDSGTRFAITDARGILLCGQNFTVSGTTVLQPGQVAAGLAGTGLTLRIGGRTGAGATAFYPVAALAALGRPNGFVPDYAAALVKGGGERLVLRALPSDGPLARRETQTADLGIDSLNLQMQMPSAPIT